MRYTLPDRAWYAFIPFLYLQGASEPHLSFEEGLCDCELHPRLGKPSLSILRIVHHTIPKGQQLRS